MTRHGNIEEGLACGQVGKEGEDGLLEGRAKVHGAEGVDYGYLLLFV